MNILITNDDGITSNGLKTLFNIFKNEHHVFVVAPASEKSGSSHAISLFKPIYYDILEKNVISLEGLPVDCVVTGLRGFFKDINFDLVLSGINKGPNLGNDIFYSGTFAAAMRAAEEGILSFAFSLATYKEPYLFGDCEEPIRIIVDKIIRNRERILEKAASFYKNSYKVLNENKSIEKIISELNCVFNVNFPYFDIDPNKIKPAYISKRDYKDKILFESKKAENFVVIEGDIPEFSTDNFVDSYLIANGYISITPVFYPGSGAPFIYPEALDEFF
ncbi:MAG: 5'/3'-nucleotidase SurE [Spirochaetes bacterium]|nr:5'/3'-nucleotidase SurE [Spirochaetota bacterium]